MSDERDTLELVARHLTGVMEPLVRAVSSEDTFRAFMLRLGWNTTGLPPEYIDLGAAVVGAVRAAEALADEPEPQEILDVLLKAKDAFVAIQGISVAPPGVDAGAFLAEIGERLFELLLTDYLAAQLPAAYNLLSILNVIEVENVAATAQKAGHIRTRFKWDEIPKIISEPQTLPARVYGWGTPDLNTLLLLQHVAELFFALRFPVVVGEADELLAGAFHEAEAGLDELPSMLKVPFFYIEIDGETHEAAFSIMELQGGAGKLPGLIIQPQIPEEFPFTLRLAQDIDLVIRAGTDIASQFGILLRPDEVTVNYPFKEGEAPPSVKLGIDFDFHPGDPALLLGSPGSTRLELQGFLVGLGTNLVDGELEVVFSAELKELALVLAAGEGDGFLNTILGDGQTRIDLSLGLDVSSRTGAHFRGSGGFEIALNPHLTLGPIAINGMTIRLNVPDGPQPKAVLELGADVSGDLGPLQLVVEGIGLAVNTVFEEGNAGPFDISLGFKPPNGVGIAIDAGVVKGGGYLYFDFEKEEYAGILELDLSGIVSVKAIGLITTRMPDGSKGFSLLIIITAEFGSPIQLGLGFTLSGVGGLLGLNRTMRLEAIATGIRDGGINSIMFPEDVVANAPRIISDLKNYFPVQADTFLIGPMVKIGWGTPNLVTVSLGIIIEIPGNIAILGVLKVVLPDEDAALIVIQVNFIGAIEFDKSRLWFFAALFESRVLYITLEGEMGLLVGWGDDASFVVSVGGFHPAFNPPPLPFGAVARIAISILNTDFARIRVEGYFAVTSNSVQFGASVEVYFGLDAFNIDGHLAFDALFRFSPFYFIITISASLSVKVFGVGLFSVRMRGSLEGPTPWHVEGTGSISLLFFDIDVDFSHTWGNEEDTTLPPISVMPLLVAEYEKLENWLAVLPAGNQLLVSLRSADEGSEEFVLHPVGSLKISQRAVPLDITIAKVGNQKPDDANRFDITVTTSGIEERGTVNESFAVGQYLDKSDSELLNAKSFEPMKGGVELSVAGEQYHAPVAVKRVVRYEQIIIDTNFKRFIRPFFTWFGSLFNLFLNGNSVSHSVLSYKQQTMRVPFADKVEVGHTLYGVAFTSDNTAFSGESMNFTSMAQAQDYMQQQVAGDANLARELHVIPQVEVQTDV